ncbi:hypothetical protein, variant 2 [Cryptococcus amylolentus CBS 6039]|uniref:Uncharacterized protein n=1 Tax=Cryptococcus amylolentus CBS 6039 TaxID=1295533 RepID=A0A1E3HE47_9TREE|nr:hypothetical protein L202_06967 [Cryptococcus amylolentus CBS 6039]XP_018990393.1 hypothetical protein, variant 1 [Cryptococcus amylolentus CBS 6039]XP_018990394.1 hypothetical protein, variant 2 [Cryptococcus amylolentus CBS 6039]ODN74611.1 hypothetical protein L202_06967 [Cryptococcus amylolentus CBS 6039]ODN74612.1 hypothetical protein, variant 1 [Cryptococcus amylolentus CBS 6039]ODN74613.1 hypothetical protein, variant 2 [Cryptococcus amylolentus CBS 6039]
MSTSFTVSSPPSLPHPSMSLPPSLLYLVVFGLLAGDTSAFSFSTSTPSQCGNFTVQWTGGTANPQDPLRESFTFWELDKP